MKKINYILLAFLTSILSIDCTNNQKKESTEIYNQKANEIILQVLKENNCNCLLEIPQKSLIQTSNEENPHYDIRSFLIQELKTGNNANLDSLVNASKDFSLNQGVLKENNIKIIKSENLLSVKNASGNEILKMCPKGIISIQKPIFDKTYQKAILENNDALTCLRFLPPPVYKFENGKWNRLQQ